MSYDPLPTGTYIIRSLFEKDGSYVGRAETEDFSLNPKRVIALPKGVKAPDVSLVLRYNITQI